MNGRTRRHLLAWMGVGGLAFAVGDLLPFAAGRGFEGVAVRALIGLVVGGLQWAVLRSWVDAPAVWMAVTVVAFASSPMAIYLEWTDQPHRVSWVAGTLATGAWIGILQMPVVRRWSSASRRPLATLVWPLAVAGSWLVTAAWTLAFKEFGSPSPVANLIGGGVGALVTAIPVALLAPRTESGTQGASA